MAAADPSRDRNPSTCRGREVEPRSGEDALDNGADGQVPPLEHLPEARRVEPHCSCPLGACANVEAKVGDRSMKMRLCQPACRKRSASEGGARALAS